jgi:hypothetical protein
MDKATKTYIDFMSKDVVKIMRERQNNPTLSIQDAIEINKEKLINQLTIS